MAATNIGSDFVPFYQKAADRIQWSDKKNDWEYTDYYMSIAPSAVSRRGKYPVGCVTSTGYRQTAATVKGQTCTLLLHRVVCFKVYGSIPQMSMDHIDGDKLNNHPSNLREVTSKINARNQKIHSRNTSGVTGVSWVESRGRWMVCWLDNKGVSKSKRFKKKEDAIAHRKKMITEMGGYTERHGL